MAIRLRRAPAQLRHHSRTCKVVDMHYAAAQADCKVQDRFLSERLDCCACYPTV